MEMSFPLHNEQIASKVDPFPCHSQRIRWKNEFSPPQRNYIMVIIILLYCFYHAGDLIGTNYIAGLTLSFYIRLFRKKGQ